ncbi:MAG: EscU/YscU/HrcU family type III secretion system export apparatus switch protein [Termitinemataceae bacterium]
MRQKRASALKYEDHDVAPQVIASGTGMIAERIIELAQNAGVTIIEDTALAYLLTEEVPVGAYIPPWCWEAVAKIFAVIRTEEEK